MNIRKLRKLDSDCAGVTIPKDDLRLAGYIDEEGDLVKQPALNVELVEDGEWRVQVLDDEDLVPATE